MSKITEIGSLEGRLCGNLAAALAKFCSMNSDQGEKGLSVPRTDMGDFRAVEDALNDIGVMEAVSRNTKSRALVFAMNADAMPDFLAQKIEAGDRRVSILVEAFIGLACGYGDTLLQDERSWFHPPTLYIQPMKWFAHTGYAERNENLFRWTEQIAPAMQANYYWNQENQNLSEVGNRELQKEAQLAWETMPETVHHDILVGKIGMFEIAKLLMLSWRDGKWHPFRLDDEINLTGQTEVSKIIIDIAMKEKSHL